MDPKINLQKLCIFIKAMCLLKQIDTAFSILVRFCITWSDAWFTDSSKNVVWRDGIHTHILKVYSKLSEKEKCKIGIKLSMHFCKAWYAKNIHGGYNTVKQWDGSIRLRFDDLTTFRYPNSSSSESYSGLLGSVYSWEMFIGLYC